MSAADRMRTIESAEAIDATGLRLRWSDGAQADLDISDWLEKPAFVSLRVPAEFARVEVGEWGHSLVWPSGAEAGADSLWLKTLSAAPLSESPCFSRHSRKVRAS